MSGIYENALASIQLGIEDFQSNDDRRPVSALRNFYAGVLLLGKQCLIASAPASSPMDVIASKFTPALKKGAVVYVPKGYQTIDLNELRDRFKSFGLHWPEGNIKDLQKLRNDFEHFHSDAPKAVVQEAIASCFMLVEGFFAILNKSPKHELGDAWDVMISERTFFAKMKADCNATFDKIPWWDEILERDRISCPSCGSSLIYQRDRYNIVVDEIEGACKACSSEILCGRVVELLVEAEYGIDAYVFAKDGGVSLINNCPECMNETYVESPFGPKCYFCEYVVEGDCMRCGVPLNVENQSFNNSSLCDYCDHMSSKDD